MTKEILFGHELQNRLENHMIDVGFSLVTYVQQPYEYLKYERPNSKSDLPDSISFHGVEEVVGTSIKAAAASGDEVQGYVLNTLKELLPEYPDMPLSESDRWHFRNERELNECLDQLVDLVTTRLFAWFENPVNNPAGMAMRPKQQLTDEQLKSKLLEGLKISESALKRALQEERTLDIERHKRRISEYKVMIEKLNI